MIDCLAWPPPTKSIFECAIHVRAPVLSHTPLQSKHESRAHEFDETTTGVVAYGSERLCMAVYGRE